MTCSFRDEKHPALKIIMKTGQINARSCGGCKGNVTTEEVTIAAYCLNLTDIKGEEVVAGIRTPQDIFTMKNCMPEAYKELVENYEILERHYKDMMLRMFLGYGLASKLQNVLPVE
nr:pyruvate, phosphate dikinase [Tanacetum cinerariifolium]